MTRRTGKRDKAKGPTQRQLRVGEALRHALAELLSRGDLRDPFLRAHSVTVTEVRVGPDLRNATVFVIPFGEGDMAELLAALRRARPYLRSELARRVPLRFTPDLSFEADSRFDRAARIEALLHRNDAVPDVPRGEDR